MKRERRKKTVNVRVRRAAAERTKPEQTRSAEIPNVMHTIELQVGDEVRVGIVLAREGDERDEIEVFRISAINN